LWQGITVTSGGSADRLNVLRQTDHWRCALERLGNFDEIAAPSAWASLEPEVSAAIRQSFRTALTGLIAELIRVRNHADGCASSELPALADRIGTFRQHYIRIERTLDYYGDAINSRTNATMQATMLGLDRIATLSMRRLLDPLGTRTPLLFTYVDRGLGASILKAGLRLWEPTILSPTAVVRIARHNLMRPTALIHETGHQVAHLLDWNDELAGALQEALAADSRELAAVWASWASEMAADTFAFVQAGYASVANLHDVLAGDTDYVLRFVPGDPHPISYLRVLLGIEMCSAGFGSHGPWQVLGDSWMARYPLAAAEPDVARLIAGSIPQLPRIARICLDTPMTAFRGRAVTDWLPPSQVSPPVLSRLERAAGPSLLRSLVWSRSDALRILALVGLRVVTEPDRMAAFQAAQDEWLRRLGERPAAA
jgi:hypothetical protein